MISVVNMKEAMMMPPGTIIYALARFSITFDQYRDYSVEGIHSLERPHIDLFKLEKLEGYDEYKTIETNTTMDFKGLNMDMGKEYKLGHLIHNFHVSYSKRDVYKDWLKDTTMILDKVSNFMKNDHSQFQTIWKADEDFSKMLKEFPEDFI